ncbi:hypothetical protein [Comamonas granuli]|uniref:hypothetical protein n=1 Tax=Comamonas granuli TaxID=290309 RepID=UPI003F70C102
MELICSGAGAMKLLAPAGVAHPAGHGGAGMDCLLCLLESAPPGVLPPRLPALPPAVQAPAPPPASFLLASMAALPPARAPPVSPVP